MSADANRFPLHVGGADQQCSEQIGAALFSLLEVLAADETLSPADLLSIACTLCLEPCAVFAKRMPVSREDFVRSAASLAGYVYDGHQRQPETRQ